ncbi:T9SS type A sorting domain-containing protein [Owenweeksia hongkongensis]|uniref:T9SS type A sorting domain-containing protein n=1 Tax=Owenweeksia hongkongensis TaxID=253245 RepID=UPI003A957778
MKKTFITVLALLFGALNAQTLLFHENFDQPSGPDSVTVSTLSGSPTTTWNDTNSLYTSSGHSFHIKGSANNSEVVFQTQPFSTIGQNHVYLQFDHIVKLFLANNGSIEVSVNNGANWNNVIYGNSYLGSSINIPPYNSFSSVSYLDWNALDFTGPNSIPNNQWWKEELFDLTNLVVSPTGFSQVIIRFRADFSIGVQPQNTFLSGWYVDDIRVLGSSCEMIPPSIDSISSVTNFCHFQSLEGLQYNATTFSHSHQVSAQDNYQIDSLRLVEIINDTLIRYTNMPLASYPSNRYVATFSGYNNFDTIKWKMEAFDICGNSSYFPDTGYYKFYFEQSFPKCATGFCNAGHNFINSFPWTQDFEDSLWIEGTGPSGSSVRGNFPEELSYSVAPIENQLSGWSIRRNSTPATLSGPNGDHTTGGGKYIYSEYQNKTNQANTIFTLPCIDLTDSVARYFSFYYHMYGADINRLALLIDSSASPTEVWHQPLIIWGEQQISSAAPWKKAFIDLSPYKGKIIRLRFASIINPNTHHYGNIAIDDLEIQDAYQYDLSVAQLNSPNTDDLACFGTSNIPVTINLANLGVGSLSSVALAYQLDNGPVVFDTIDASTLSLGEDSIFTFSTPLSLSPSSSHTLKVWSDLLGDQRTSNDTVQLDIPVLQLSAINTFPYILHFDNSIAVTGQPANLNSPHWTISSNDSAFFWEINSGYFTDDIFAPSNGFGVEGNCLVFRSRVGRPGQLKSSLESQCIDLSSLSNPILNLDYFTSYGQSLSIYASEYGQSSWTLISPYIQNTPLQSNLLGLKVSLAAYAGKVIQLKIEVNNPPQNYMAVLDNITIREQPTKDLALTMVDLVQVDEGTNTYPSIAINFSNWNDTSSTTNFPKVLHVALINKCDPTLPVIYGQSDTSYNFNSGQNTGAIVNSLSFQSTVPAGDYRAKFWLETPGDLSPENDTIYQDLVSLGSISLPYFNDFENCYNEVSPYGRMKQWEVATPQKNKLDSALKGTSCIVTNADTNALNHNAYNSYFELPTFSGLDTLYNVRLEFWQYFDFSVDNSNFGAVEIYDGQNWAQLTNAGLYGVNWKSYISSTSNSNYPKGFTGNSNGWIRSSYPLDEFNTPGPKKLRFVTSASKVFGWAIDSIAIYVPSQNSGSPLNLEFTNLIPKQGANDGSVQISNTAEAPLSQVEVSIATSSSSVVTENFSLNPPLKKGQSRWLVLSNAIQLDTSITELIIYTSNPNNRKDDINNDDTLIIPISVISNFNDTLPLCFDFESSQYFAPLNASTGIINTSWEKGVPSKTIFNSPHQGSNAWFTSGNEYQPLLNTYLYTPVFEVTGQQCYTLSFWHQYDTELNYDGCQVELSLDSGITWQTLGKYWSTDTAWYNTQAIQSLDGVKPGWSGSSNGWKKAQNDFKVFWDTSMQFRFRFASNASNHGEGWIIDDLCLELSTGSCETVGQEELQSMSGTLSLYPSPTYHSLTVELPLSQTLSNYTYQIYNLQGQIVLDGEFENNRKGGQSIIVETLAKGLYTIRITSEAKTTYSAKFMKN